MRIIVSFARHVQSVITLRSENKGSRTLGRSCEIWSRETIANDMFDDDHIEVDINHNNKSKKKNTER